MVTDFRKKIHSFRKKESIVCWLIMLLMALLCILPLLLVLSASLTPEKVIQESGYSLFPSGISLDTYSFLVSNKGRMLLSAIFNSILVTTIGTLFSVIVVTTFAYAVTQKKEVFRYTRILSFLAWFTTICSGGMLPWYILCTQTYGLKNNYFALFVPYGMSVWNMFIVRGSFRQVPDEMTEAAKLDGASDAQIFFRIAIPLARAGIVTIALFSILTFWNDFYLPQWLITDSTYQTLPKLLYNMLTNTMALLSSSNTASVLTHVKIPSETAKMAIAVISILPIGVLYPFALKYFVKGINMGGIKG